MFCISDKSDGPNKVITNKPPPPKKPLPVLPAVKKLEQQSPKPCKESLSVKPTLAASRTSPHKSPLNAKNGNDGTDVVQGSSDKGRWLTSGESYFESLAPSKD